MTPTSRWQRVRREMARRGLEQLIITQPQSIYYLTGEWVNPHDRLDALILTPDGCRALCHSLAELHSDQCEITVYRNAEDAVPRLSALMRPLPTGVDGSMPTRFLLPLMQRLPNVAFQVSDCVETARMYKDEDEIARLAHASEVTDRVFARAFAALREGMTELELGKVFSDGFAQEGVGPFPGDPMVCFGAGASEPHHQPGHARLTRGDAVMVDTGKRIDGYYSDMTRTVFFGEADAEQRAVYEVVLEANEAALRAVRPGAALGEIHQAACEVIARAGYGAYYPHRTSHGIGIDYHEEPFDREGQVLPIEPGMCFSVEPGIYLPGRFGVRIEDLVAVTRDGYRLLNHFPKALQVLEGPAR